MDAFNISKQKACYLFITVSIFIFSTLLPSHAAVPTAEKDALFDLYSSTNGASWTTSTNWNNGDPCDNNWYGITCNAGGTNIIAVYLGNNNLVGSIPPSIDDLSKLQVLVFYTNSLSSSIPPEIGNLNKAGTIELSYNSFTGSIPPELGKLNSIGFLYLDHNSLSGSIPPELGNLSQLQELWLNGNYTISSSIPKELGNLVNLTALKLNDNQLCGAIPPTLINLTNLKNGNGLYLNNNNLITETNQPLTDFITTKSNLLTDWKTTQESRGYFPWPMSLPSITGAEAN